MPIMGQITFYYLFVHAPVIVLLAWRFPQLRPMLLPSDMATARIAFLAHTIAGFGIFIVGLALANRAWHFVAG